MLGVLVNGRSIDWIPDVVWYGYGKIGLRTVLKKKQIKCNSTFEFIASDSDVFNHVFYEYITNLNGITQLFIELLEF